MSWTDFFRSRYVRYLEKQIVELKAEIGYSIIKSARDIAQLREDRDAELLRIDFDHRIHTSDLKKAHAEALTHAIEENRELRDTVERYRVALNPTVAKPDNTPPPEMPDIGGSPWQRVLKREMQRQEA